MIGNCLIMADKIEALMRGMWIKALMRRMSIFLRRFYWKIKKILHVKLPIKIIQGDYPSNTVYIGRENKRTKFIVVECNPGKRIIFANDMNYRNSPICLYFPYTYFVIKYTQSISPLGNFFVYMGMFVGFSNQRIKNTSEVLYSLPFSNQTGFFSYCLGSSEPKYGPYVTVRELYESCANSFWHSRFQQDSTPGSFLSKWCTATKLGYGENYIAEIIQNKIPINQLIGGTENEQFFEYKSEC